MDSLEKELAAVEKREKKLLAGGLKKGKVKQAVYDKVPEKVGGLLEAAFSKAFKTVFINGTPLSERTFDKEGAGLEFEARDYIVDRAGNKKSLRRLDKQAKKDSKINHAATTAAGFGLGFLGLGLPDIPLMVGTILRASTRSPSGTAWTIAARRRSAISWRLICTALSDGDERSVYNRKLDSMEYGGGTLAGEIASTARMLSDALLVEKFVQGLPVVGVVGGAVNFSIYRRIGRAGGGEV